MRCDMKTSTKQNTMNINWRNATWILPLFVVAFAICLTSSSVRAQGINDIEWLSNVEQAKKMASEQNKLVLLHFTAAWSRPCKSLDTYVFKSSAVKKSIAANVIPVKLDADRALNLVNEYNVAMVPFDIVITPGGRVVSERRSPSDSENYSKMINGTANASRMLEKEKLGPIAHQHEVIKNRSLVGQDPLDFRAKGPEAVEMGLSKDGSLLQRRQKAFTDNNSVTKTNPYMGSANGDQRVAAGSGSRVAAAGSGSRVAVEDLERDQFLRRERNWVAPSTETRRAKPQRVVNDRYFESIAATQKPAAAAGPFSLASNSRQVPDSIHGDFRVNPPATDSMLSGVMAGDAPSAGLLDLTPTRKPKVDREKMALKGKCPVTLLTEGRWVDGDPQHGIVHRDRTYIFASADMLATFRTNPDKYSPVLAGYDPVIYHENGKLVKGLVENGVFMGRMPDQKVVLFKDAETRSKFQAAPKDYMETIRQATNKSDSQSMLR